MKIKIDDSKVVYMTTLLLKMEKPKEGMNGVYTQYYDIQTDLQKEAKNDQHAIEMSIEKAKKRKGFISVITQSSMNLTPKIFQD